MGDGHRAVAREQHLRHRLADDVGAPDDDRLLARSSSARAPRRPSRSGSSRPAGVQGTSARFICADRQQPDIDRVKAVDVLVRARSPRARAPRSIGLGSGNCTRTPCIAGSALSLSISASSSASDVSPADCAGRNGSRKRWRPCPCRDIDLARGILADQHHRQTRLDACASSARAWSATRARRPSAPPCRRERRRRTRHRDSAAKRSSRSLNRFAAANFAAKRDRSRRGAPSRRAPECGSPASRTDRRQSLPGRYSRSRLRGRGTARRAASTARHAENRRAPSRSPRRPLRSKRNDRLAGSMKHSASPAKSSSVSGSAAALERNWRSCAPNQAARRDDRNLGRARPSRNGRRASRAPPAKGQRKPGCRPQA